MAGLGLSLRLDDFRDILRNWRNTAVAIGVQMIVLLSLALGLAITFQLAAPLAVGLVLLAATPGSISANLYSHLFGGDVAFNVSLTGLNTLLCAVTLPLLCAWSAAPLCRGANEAVPILLDKAFEVIAIVFIPISAGMMIRAKAPRLALRAARPVKIVSAGSVVFFSIAAIANEWQPLMSGFLEVGASVLVFNILSLAIAYAAARFFSLGREATITVAFQASIHNALSSHLRGDGHPERADDRLASCDLFNHDECVGSRIRSHRQAEAEFGCLYKRAQDSFA